MKRYRALNPAGEWAVVVESFDPDSNSITRYGPELSSFLFDLVPQNTSIMVDLFVVFPLYTINLSGAKMQLYGRIEMECIT